MAQPQVHVVMRSATEIETEPTGLLFERILSNVVKITTKCCPGFLKQSKRAVRPRVDFSNM